MNAKDRNVPSQKAIDSKMVIFLCTINQPLYGQALKAGVITNNVRFYFV